MKNPIIERLCQQLDPIVRAKFSLHKKTPSSPGGRVIGWPITVRNSGQPVAQFMDDETANRFINAEVASICSQEAQRVYLLNQSAQKAANATDEANEDAARSAIDNRRSERDPG